MALFFFLQNVSKCFTYEELAQIYLLSDVFSKPSIESIQFKMWVN